MTPTPSSTLQSSSSVDATHEFEVFFDGDCPLCKREISMLQRWDKRDRILFTDITATSFDAERDTGLSFDTLMARIHGRVLPSGEIVEGVDVFRRLYNAIGLGWLVAPTRIPGISHLLELAYRLFAKNRLRFTGRCETESCAVPPESTK